MIVVRITMNVLPEKQKEMAQTLLSMMGAMEREEECLNCSFLCDMKNNNLFCVFEEWENRAKLDHHLKSDLFGVLLGTKSLLSQPHGIHIYTVQQDEGMSAVHTARANG